MNGRIETIISVPPGAVSQDYSNIGANIREAHYAESKKDFVHKLNISLKECNESLFWISSIKQCNLIDDPILKDIERNCFTILRLLKSAINTTKEKYNV